jgi:hypothetical protein
MLLSLGLPLALAVIGQDIQPPDPVPLPPGLAAARLAYMKQSVSHYDIRPGDDRDVKFQLQPEPALRFTNPMGRARDGTVFLWLDGVGRPAAVVQVSLNGRLNWVHEFSSLSPKPFTARSDRGHVWDSSTGGVVFKPVPDAPRPSETPERRLAQMRELTRRFAVEDNFHRQSLQPLRLLSKPFARYDSPKSGVLDGALFCYVLTTDPEAYLMLEVREEKGVPAWHFAFAPSTVFPLKASWDGKTVWECNIDQPESGSTKTLYQFRYSDERITADPKVP